LSKEEFRAFIEFNFKGSEVSEDRVNSDFEMFDKNNDQKIDLKEIQEVARAYMFPKCATEETMKEAYEHMGLDM